MPEPPVIDADRYNRKDTIASIGSFHLEEAVLRNLEIICRASATRDGAGTSSDVYTVLEHCSVNMDADGLTNYEPLIKFDTLLRYQSRIRMGSLASACIRKTQLKQNDVSDSRPPACACIRLKPDLVWGYFGGIFRG